jgi:hypothetical protein
MSTTNEQINELKKEISEMQKSQAEINKQLLEALGNLSTIMSITGTAKEPEPIKETTNNVKFKQKSYDNTLEQPKSDELIRIVSICKGELNLVVDGNLAIRLEKFGDIKPVLYSQLVTIVNQNRHFAEAGLFYILDDRAVYYLGLSEYYKKIIPIETIEGIGNYSDDDIKQIVSVMNDSQKEVLCKVLADKIYANENIDRNKVELVSKVCNIDIQGKVREMQEMAEIM